LRLLRKAYVTAAESHKFIFYAWQTFSQYSQTRIIEASTMINIVLFALIAIPRTMAQSIPACALACVTPICTAGAADIVCVCQPTNIAAIGSCVATGCTATVDLAQATSLAALLCAGSRRPSKLMNSGYRGHHPTQYYVQCCRLDYSPHYNYYYIQ